MSERKKKIDFYRHDLKPAAAKDVARVIGSTFLTSGAVGKQVEAQIANYFGTEYGVLVNSWTNGALATLLALGIGPGHEVIVPAMTFIASANIVELVGAKPTFVDVDPDTLLMTPDRVAKALTPATRAVIPVHIYGQMLDVAALRAALGGRTDVHIIEDCAHCFEGTLGGQKPGVHSTAAIFSFYATKNVTCGEGGAIVTNDPALTANLMKIRMHGMSAGAIDRFNTGSYRHWDMEQLGIKANLPDLLACLLPPQIETIDERLPIREMIAQRYEKAFLNSGIRVPVINSGVRHARHLFVIHVPPAVRDTALACLAANGIGCTVNYRSVPDLTYYANKYRYAADAFPNSAEWGGGTISLPFYPSMTTDSQDYVIDIVLSDVTKIVRQGV